VKVPGIKNRPFASVVANVPALEPTMTSTLLPPSDREAVSATEPDSKNSSAVDAGSDGAGCVGDTLSPHPTRKSTMSAAK
jgi:hypothetical protein